MAGAVFFVVLAAVVLLILIGVANPLFLIPIIAVGLGVLVVPLILGALRGTAVGEPEGGSSGVPTTREASYDPVREP
ncbi:MAG TPA: hypothetical protein VF257_07375 [Solirubrobacteraceae bacterium]